MRIEKYYRFRSYQHLLDYSKMLAGNEKFSNFVKMNPFKVVSMNRKQRSVACDGYVDEVVTIDGYKYCGTYLISPGEYHFFEEVEVEEPEEKETHEENVDIIKDLQKFFKNRHFYVAINNGEMYDKPIKSVDELKGVLASLDAIQQAQEDVKRAQERLEKLESTLLKRD